MNFSGKSLLLFLIWLEIFPFFSYSLTATSSATSSTTSSTASTAATSGAVTLPLSSLFHDLPLSSTSTPHLFLKVSLNSSARRYSLVYFANPLFLTRATMSASTKPSSVAPSPTSGLPVRVNSQMLVL